MHIHTQSYTFIYPYTISAHFCFMYIHVYVRYTYACTHMHTTCIPCTHIYYVHICLYIHTNAPYSRNFFFNCGTLSPKCGDPGEHPPMWSESSSSHLLGWISAMERKVMMVKLVWIWLSHMSLTVFVCACMPLSPREVRGQLRAVGALLPHCELKGWTQVFQLSHLPGPVAQYCFSGVLGMKLGVVHGGHLLLCPCWPLLYPSGVSLGHIWWRLFFLPSSGSCWPGTMQNQVGTSFL